MLIRARGKGACAENSQAVLMHLRGFRYSHTPSPEGGSYDWIDFNNSNNTNTDNDDGFTTRTRPFRYPHFSIGLHCPDLTKGSVNNNNNTNEGTFSSSQRALAWKELWNVYDICYDAVPLLPDDFEYVESQFSVLAEPKGEKREREEEGEVVLALPKGFTLPSAQGELSKKLIVCSHYCADALWPPERFTSEPNWRAEVGDFSSPSAVVIVVIDLSDLPLQEAGRRLAVELAWCIAFASLSPDHLLLRARAFVVRLPYSYLPSPSCGDGASTRVGGMAAAYEEMVDFIGQYLKVVWTAFSHSFLNGLLSCDGSRNDARGFPHAAPGVLFVGKSEEELVAKVGQLQTHYGGPSDDEGEVVILRTDNHPSELGEVLLAQRTEESQRLAGGLKGTAVRLLLASVRALLEGGEEPLDPYTQRELARLNFCPCCGSCGDGGDSQGHSHDHHH